MLLQSLSDKAILSRVRELTRRERSLTLQVLLHLNEIGRRNLHLKLGFASMFDYCTSGLGYSASAAARRLRTAGIGRGDCDGCGDGDRVECRRDGPCTGILEPGDAG